jgi:CRP-like cAMP-binding protein
MVQSFLPNQSAVPDLRELLEQLYQERSLKPFRNGQSIPLGDDQIWVLCRGIVTLNTLYPTGDEALLGIATPSMPFGLPLTSVRPYHAIALTDADLMPLTLSDLERSPALSQGIFIHLGRRLKQAEALLSLASYRRVEERLREFLLLLAEEIGQPHATGTRLNIKLTHQQIANAIGTTRVTVTRLLGQLRDEGWLSIEAGRQIVVNCPLPSKSSEIYQRSW